jgi:hypothetical protein
MSLWMMHGWHTSWVDAQCNAAYIIFVGWEESQELEVDGVLN